MKRRIFAERDRAWAKYKAHFFDNPLSGSAEAMGRNTGKTMSQDAVIHLGFFLHLRLKSLDRKAKQRAIRLNKKYHFRQRKG